MSREEAIKIFNTVLFFGKCDCQKEEIEECLRMAIEALEKEPCEDCISRQAAIDALSHMCSEDENGITVSRANVNSMLRLLPPVTPQQKTGHWISKPHIYGVAFCSKCGFELKMNNTNYCPNCGAKMVEPQESEDKNNGKIRSNISVL